jgi:signal peptidase II
LKSPLRRWLRLFILIAGILIVDQATKRLIEINLELGQSLRPIPALSPFFQITRSHNTGAAFGTFSQGGDVLLIVNIIIVSGLILYYRRFGDHEVLKQIAAGLVCGGALGNIIDRLEYGFVIDFIHYTIPDVISNVSNLADHAIVLGVILFLIDNWRAERRAARTTEAAEPVPPPAA